jgi:hypothetical protein
MYSHSSSRSAASSDSPALARLAMLDFVQAAIRASTLRCEAASRQDIAGTARQQQLLLLLLQLLLIAPATRG